MNCRAIYPLLLYSLLPAMADAATAKAKSPPASTSRARAQRRLLLDSLPGPHQGKCAVTPEYYSIAQAMTRSRLHFYIHLYLAQSFHQYYIREIIWDYFAGHYWHYSTTWQTHPCGMPVSGILYPVQSHNCLSHSLHQTGTDEAGNPQATGYIWNSQTGAGQNQHITLDALRASFVKLNSLSPQYSLIAMARSASNGMSAKTADGSTITLYRQKGSPAIVTITHIPSIVALAFAMNGKYLCIGSPNGIVTILDTDYFREVDRLHHDTGVTALHHLPTGSNGLYVGLGDGSVAIWYAYDLTQKPSKSISADDSSCLPFKDCKTQ